MNFTVNRNDNLEYWVGTKMQSKMSNFSLFTITLKKMCLDMDMGVWKLEGTVSMVHRFT